MRVRASAAFIFAIAQFRTVLSATAEQISYYSEQLREQTMAQESNFREFGGQGKSFYRAQIHSEGNFINRYSGYFSPKGVSVFNSSELNRAVQWDQLERQTSLLSLNRGLESKIMDLEFRQSKSLQSVLDPSGALKTYDKSAILNSESNMRILSQNARQLADDINSGYKSEFRKMNSAPYFVKSDLVQRLQKSDGAVNFYLNGSGGSEPGFKGIRGMIDSMIETASALKDIRYRIERQEDGLRDNLFQRTVQDGIQILGSTFLAPVTGGTSLLGLVSSLPDMGMAVRQNIVLNVRGLEGLRSASEISAANAYGSFQTGSNLAQIALGIEEILKEGFRQGSQAAKDEGFLAENSDFFLTNSQKETLAVKGYRLADASGLTSLFLNEDQSASVRGALALRDLVHSARQAIPIKSSSGNQEIKTAVLDEMRNADRISVYIQLPETTLKDALDMAKAFKKGQKWIQENSLSLGWAGVGSSALNIAGEIFRSRTFTKNYDSAVADLAKSMVSSQSGQNQSLLSLTNNQIKDFLGQASGRIKNGVYKEERYGGVQDGIYPQSRIIVNISNPETPLSRYRESSLLLQLASNFALKSGQDQKKSEPSARNFIDPGVDRAVEVFNIREKDLRKLLKGISSSDALASSRNQVELFKDFKDLSYGYSRQVADRSGRRIISESRNYENGLWGNLHTAEKETSEIEPGIFLLKESFDSYNPAYYLLGDKTMKQDETVLKNKLWEILGHGSK